MPRRILLTGSGGFVGRHLAARLSQHSQKFELLTVVGPSQAGGVDLADFSQAYAMVEGFRPDIIIHLAARSSVGFSADDPGGVWADNFDATRNLGKAAAQLGLPVHMVFASSAEVYGASFNLGVCTENSPLSPVSAYGRTKAAAEMILQDLSGHNLAVTVLRLFNHIGPGQDERFVVSTFAGQVARGEQAAAGQGYVEVGNLDAYRDFSSVEDVLEAYLAVIEAPGPERSFDIFNVGSGQPRRVGDILSHFLRLAVQPLEVRFSPGRMRPSDIPTAAGDFSKFQQTFGWRAHHDLDATLSAILDWHRSAVNAHVE